LGAELGELLRTEGFFCLQVLVLSLLHGIPLGATIVTPLFKALLKQPMGIADLEEVKPELALQVVVAPRLSGFGARSAE
jgi:hypothetical protein